MDKYGVAILHTKEFHDTKGVFKGWSRDRKKAFARELFLPFDRRLYALSMTVNKKSLQMAKEMGQHQNMSAYGVCFSAIMTRLLIDQQVGPHVRQEGVSFLVEDGNNNNSEIEQFFNKHRNEPAFEGCMRSIKFIAKGSCKAIQLADYWAFYSRRFMRENDRFAGKLSLPTNFYYEIIRRNYPVWEQAIFDITKGQMAAKLGSAKSFSDLEASLIRSGKAPFPRNG